MLIAPNRRRQDRRAEARVPEALERKRERRADDRRDTERPLRRLYVRSSVAPLAIEHRAVLSLEGATWTSWFAPPEEEVELLFQLPDMPREQLVHARIERRRELGGGETELYARFLDLELNTELALARFIEARARLSAELAASPLPLRPTHA
jgi:hypothetical protein